MIHYSFLAIGICFVFLLIWFSVISWQEKEKLATIRSLAISCLTVGVIISIFLLRSLLPDLELIALIAIASIFFFLFFPIDYLFSKNKEEQLVQHRFDERDIMFSRMALQSGTERYNEYYSKNQEIEKKDLLFRANAGLLQKGSLLYKQGMMGASTTNFRVIDHLQPLAEGHTASIQKQDSAENFTRFVLAWAKKIGAKEIGITKLNPSHLYSHKGRGAKYGQPVTCNHSFAIVFTVEMDWEMVSAAPNAPIVMESSQQYLRAATIAVQLAEWIRTMGFEARAHIDANYEVICPLVARDAGLGEIGRMGLLITRNLGPRVRLAVVSTDLPLIPTKRRKDSSVEAFCEKCKKCAICCPSKSIPSDRKENIGGVRRWQIDSESCFTYWSKIGTDCGRCMHVCPYSHPDHPLHNFIRWGIRRNPLFRHVALIFDNFFYGTKPASKKIPRGMDV